MGNIAHHAQHGAVEVNVLAPAQFGVKASAKFQQRIHPSIKLHPSAGGAGDVRKDLEQSALASSVAVDNALRIALFPSNVTSSSAQKLVCAGRRSPFSQRRITIKVKIGYGTPSEDRRLCTTQHRAFELRTKNS